MIDRMQKKCLVGSLSVHGLLLVILFVGPAFLSNPKNQNEEIIDFIPSSLVDAAVSGGGNRDAKPLPYNPQIPPKPPEPNVPVVPKPPEPEPVKPAPEAKPEVKPEPVAKPDTRTEKIDPDAVEPAKKKGPNISLKVETAKPGKKATSKNSPSTRPTQENAERQQLARQFGQAAASLRNGTASATRYEEYGPGGGGPSYAGFSTWVRTVYHDAWQPPAEVTLDDAIVEASVTIARDGKIVSSRITRRSGDTAVDASVQQTLDRVRTIGRSFPEGARERERSYIIEFNLRAKRGMA